MISLPTLGKTSILNMKYQLVLESIILDGLVKSHKVRHSRVNGSPEPLKITGFPLSRE